MTATTPLAALAQNNPATMIVVLFFVLTGLISLILLVFMIQYFNLWLQAMMSGAPIAFPELIGMRFRKVDARLVVITRIRAMKAGLDLSTTQLETHYLAGGNISSVVDALILAQHHDIDLPWDVAGAIDLAGYDVRAAVQAAIDHELSPQELCDPSFLKRIGIPQVGTAPT